MAFYPTLGLAYVTLASLLVLIISGRVTAESATVWVGTRTPREGESRGIYRSSLDLDTGKLDEPVLAAEIASPGFVALHPNNRWLYSVCQLADGQGGVAAFEISAREPYLRLMNTEPIGDGGAAHLAVDATGHYLFTAQYGGGSIAVFPLADTGHVLPRASLVEHQGSGPDAGRQEGPHPHWVGTDPGNRYLFVPDLGIDEVVIYRFDSQSGKIDPHGQGSCPPGAGPRHMKFHPQANFAYVANELQLSVTVFRYDPDSGTLEAIQTISTLPEEPREVPCSVSEIRIHPTGRFLYVANRGHDSITAFRVDPATGELEFIQREAIRGSWPRNFNIDPTGTWLLAAGARSNTISVFRIDPETGGLTFTGSVAACPTPICIEFQP